MTGFQLPTGAANGYVLTTDALGNGTWQASTAGGGTLDNAYDFGGPGAGRIITADGGAVEVNMASPSGTALDLNVSGNNGIGARADLTAAGVGFLAASTNANNGFSAIQASTNSNNNLASAIVGNSDGLAWGVSGQVSANATAQGRLVSEVL